MKHMEPLYLWSKNEVRKREVSLEHPKNKAIEVRYKLTKIQMKN